MSLFEEMLTGTCEPWPRKIKKLQEMQKNENSRSKEDTICTLVATGMQRMHRANAQMQRVAKTVMFDSHSPFPPVLLSQCGEGSAQPVFHLSFYSSQLLYYTEWPSKLSTFVFFVYWSLFLKLYTVQDINIAWDNGTIFFN